MQVSQGIAGLRNLPKRSVISIGNFDGVHLGHQAILAHMKSLANGSPTAAVTFEPHPLTVLRPHLAPPRLSTAAQKERLIAAAGVSHYVILPPTPEVLGLTAEEFWAILRDQTQPTYIVEGRAFNFGRDRGGTIQRLQEWAAPTPIKIDLVPSATCTLTDRTMIDISSSTIRWLLGNGRVRDAANCLGRPFVLSGTVIEGFQRGRTIGVPTANLSCGDLLVPADGVYAGRCKIEGAVHAAAISIGTTPTFSKQQYQIEVHLINFSGDLYGKTLEVELLDWLRDQSRFPNIDVLKMQLRRDIDASAIVASR